MVPGTGRPSGTTAPRPSRPAPTRAVATMPVVSVWPYMFTRRTPAPSPSRIASGRSYSSGSLAVRIIRGRQRDPAVSMRAGAAARR